MTYRNDEVDIREVLEDFAGALHAKDAARAIATFADDVVAFDLAPPLRVGPEDMHDPNGLENWFGTWKGPIESAPHDRTIVVDGDLAHVHGLQHMTGTKNDGEEVDLWFRATACLRREKGRWWITHMHNSVPFAMDGSERALLDLKPESLKASNGPGSSK